MSKWSQEAARKYAENKKNAEARLLDQNVLKSKAPKMWEQLRDLFAQEVTAFNAEPGMEGILVMDNSRPGVLEVSRTDSPSKARIVFESHSQTVKILVPGIEKDDSEIKMVVLSGSTEARFENSKRLPVQPHLIVETVLRKLLGLH
jgi:hypothetical protein